MHERRQQHQNLYQSDDVPSPNYEKNKKQIEAALCEGYIRNISGALCAYMFSLGFILSANNPRESASQESILHARATASADETYDPYALRVSMSEPTPEEVMLMPLTSPRMMIIEIPPEDLYPERMRELIRKALEEVMQSGSLPFEGIEIQTDGDISPEEMEQLIHEALEPPPQPQREPVTT